MTRETHLSKFEWGLYIAVDREVTRHHDDYAIILHWVRIIGGDLVRHCLKLEGLRGTAHRDIAYVNTDIDIYVRVRPGVGLAAIGCQGLAAIAPLTSS